MIATSQYIAQLIYSRLNGKITEAEEMELTSWLQESGRSPFFAEDIDDESMLSKWISDYAIDITINRKQLILEHIRAKLQEDRSVIDSPRRVHVHFLRTAWFKYASAIIILFGIGAYLWTTTQKEKPNIVQVDSVKHDILPGGQKAILTLADGREIILDSAKNGQLANENGSDIIKRDGEIIYDAGQIRSEAVVYNTMSTPRGGQYQLTLPDGTKVWLNAASKIIYPTRFVGKNREVKVEGEVYLEIKPNKYQPFIVKTNSDEIQVLGTEFNINNYPDEPASKISLIDGAVKVNNQLLQPGQAYVKGKIITTNIEQDVAWRNGIFAFKEADIKTVMRQFARWYDIEVKYAGSLPTAMFNGEIGRSLTLNQVMSLLTERKYSYTITGKIITILPKK